MKVYLVGGAVRDQFLGYPYEERDWVVVGSSPDELRRLNYKQVGKDFPVFLHPKTGEEYALARKERKKGHGYYGFECEFNRSVTLEEDLARRDITINAMALDDANVLYDPFGGFEDLKNKIIRHVSDAFVEDPVRVLRVARFVARYHHLGFVLAPETAHLMRKMVFEGELKHLVAERVWMEWAKSLKEPNPEQFILVLRQTGALKEIIPEIDELFGIPNSPKYHPEIDTGIHSILALKACAKLTNNAVIRFAALTHDLGKAKTPRIHWPAHHKHEHLGEEVIMNMCKRLKIPNIFQQFALNVCRYHLVVHQAGILKPSTMVSLMENVNAFKKPEDFDQLLLACLADYLGRKSSSRVYEPMNIWKKALSVCSTVEVQPIIEAGFEGRQIKEELHQRRVNQLKLFFKERDEKQ